MRGERPFAEEEELGQKAENEALVGPAHSLCNGSGQPHVLQSAVYVQRIEHMMKGIAKACHHSLPVGITLSSGALFCHTYSKRSDASCLPNVTFRCK